MFDWMIGALLLVMIVVAIALFISNAVMTNRVLKDMEEQRRKQKWSWN
jgi:hypothetical protein